MRGVPKRIVLLKFNISLVSVALFIATVLLELTYISAQTVHMVQTLIKAMFKFVTTT